jgi:hypothetical protein
MSQIAENYTTVSFENVVELLAFYNVGQLHSFTPLNGGFANSNFKLILKNNKGIDNDDKEEELFLCLKVSLNNL